MDGCTAGDGSGTGGRKEVGYRGHHILQGRFDGRIASCMARGKGDKGPSMVCYICGVNTVGDIEHCMWSLNSRGRWNKVTSKNADNAGIFHTCAERDFAGVFDFRGSIADIDRKETCKTSRSIPFVPSIERCIELWRGLRSIPCWPRVRSE